MKPYLVHKTWIDLDHVVAIESARQSPGCGGDNHARVTFLTRSDVSTEINIGPEETARDVLDNLIAAWKSKDDSNVHVIPPAIYDEPLISKKLRCQETSDAFGPDGPR